MKKKERTNRIRVSTKNLPRTAKEEIERIRNIPDSAIDFSDMPELDLKSSQGRRAVMISLRLESDLLEWFRGGGPGYQTRIRQALREHVRRSTTSPTEADQLADAIVKRLKTLKPGAWNAEPTRRRKSA